MSHCQLRETDAIDDRHPVDFIEPIEPSEPPGAEIIRAIVHWLSSQKTTDFDLTPSHMGARVMVLRVALGFDSQSWADIGRRCDISREGVRLMAKELERNFGLRAVNARSDSARAASRRARNQHLTGKLKNAD